MANRMHLPYQFLLVGCVGTVKLTITPREWLRKQYVKAIIEIIPGILSCAAHILDVSEKNVDFYVTMPWKLCIS